MPIALRAWNRLSNCAISSSALQCFLERNQFHFQLTKHIKLLDPLKCESKITKLPRTGFTMFENFSYIFSYIINKSKILQNNAKSIKRSGVVWIEKNETSLIYQRSRNLHRKLSINSIVTRVLFIVTAFIKKKLYYVINR